MTIKEFEIQYALGSLSYDMIKKLAYNRRTPVKILAILSGDKGSDVRYWVTRNLNTPVKILTILSEDEDWDVKCSAKRRFIIEGIQMKNKEKKMTKKQQEERLAELYARIKREVKFVNIKPYSHNIISLNLHTICKEFGYNKANEAIDKFGLTSLGWEHQKEPKTNEVRSSK